MFSSKENNDFIKFIKPDFTFEDSRGSLNQIVSKGKWSQVNFIESAPSSIRGNHYHEINRELFYIIQGRFYLTLEMNGIKKMYDIVAKDLFIIEPYVLHSFEYIEKTMLIAMYDKGVELENGKKDILTI
jgi:dTDP-4-dehydrorhamnose 3,5-epimerase-like enzyme